MAKAKVRLTPEQDAQLKADYKSGMKGQELADKYKISLGTVRNKLGLNTGTGGSRAKNPAKVIAKLALPANFDTLKEVEDTLLTKLEEVKAKRVECKAEEIKRLEDEKAALDKKLKDLKKS
jgi:hypothetical protein